MLQIVSISKTDIIATSNKEAIISNTPTDTYLAPDRFNDWDAGY